MHNRPDTTREIVADNDPGMREMIIDYLDEQDFAVRGAASGVELD